VIGRPVWLVMSLKSVEDQQSEAAQWIEAITDSKVEGDFASSLRTGEVLCKLLNCLRPGTVTKVNRAGTPFKERDNISNFLKGCRTFGVQEHSLFCTDDLYEDKNLLSVVVCIHALGGVVQRSVPEFKGPRLGVVDASSPKRASATDLRSTTQTGGDSWTCEKETSKARTCDGPAGPSALLLRFVGSLNRSHLSRDLSSPSAEVPLCGSPKQALTKRSRFFMCFMSTSVDHGGA